jgi:hypothetical protein
MRMGVLSGWVLLSASPLPLFCELLGVKLVHDGPDGEDEWDLVAVGGFCLDGDCGGGDGARDEV